MGQPAVACPTTKEKAGGTNSPSPNWKPYLGSRHGFNQFRRAEMISLHIPNMPCGSCVCGVTAAVHETDAHAWIEPSLQEQVVAIETTLHETDIRTVLADAGFAPALTTDMKTNGRWISWRSGLGTFNVPDK